ncbi:MAG: capsular polysaccharide biosynthesis protein CapF [Erysipelotrichaceae bacterium]|nr:capsular polysaccharide biosynthesis protein CapF [Erysipelotrichaceae bacterium]
MRILVTGAKGFIGKNLIVSLLSLNQHEIFSYDKDTDPELLDKYCQSAEFVFHLAGVNRPQDQAEFMRGNHDLTATLLNTLKKYRNCCPVMIASSIQAELNNPYGISKKAGEDLLFAYAKETHAKVYVYRFPNVFGKWCRPNYNSVVATFCHNIANDHKITINDSKVIMNLVYIDDVVDELIRALTNRATEVDGYCIVPTVYTISLGKIAELIYSFKQSRIDNTVPNLSDPFCKKLYSTYLSYLPSDRFSYDLKMNNDQRGSFTEFIKTIDRGQISINISRPHIVKGNHWHHTKNEKFLVVSGKGVIRFRDINSTEVIEYFVSGDKLQVVDIPVGYTHNIENLGDTDMVTIMWANELFDQKRPDTYYLEV